MGTKALRFGAAFAGLLALAGFAGKAQAQVVNMPVNPNFRLPLTTGGLGGLGLGLGGGILNTGFGIGGGGLLANTPTFIPPPAYGAPSVSYLIAPGSYQNPPLPSYMSNSGSATLSTNPSGGSGTGWGTLAPGYDPFYSNSYYPDYSPAGGYLRGKADLVSSYGNFMVSNQRAAMLQQEVTRSSVDTRRKIWEEAQWERMNTIWTEDYREQYIKTEQRRARFEPPLNEIWSGRTLNVLLKADAAQQAKGVRGPTIAIPEDVLKHINLTVGVGGTGNIGLLKADSLRWPTGLEKSPDFAASIKNLDQRLPEAREQARLNNKVQPGLLTDIRKDVQNMQDALRGKVDEMGPPDYIEAKRYLNNLSEAVKSLSDPNVQNYLTGKYSAKGRSVADLIDNMTRVQGLEFAPATPGDEAAYRALYHLFQNYDTGMTQTNTSAPAPPTSPGPGGSGDK